MTACGERRLIGAWPPTFTSRPSDCISLIKHVERFRRAGFERVVALDDALVDARAALHVVGLHGEQFLQV